MPREGSPWATPVCWATKRYLLGYVKNPLSSWIAHWKEKRERNLLGGFFPYPASCWLRLASRELIPLYFRIVSPRSFSICLRSYIPGQRCDVSSMSRSGTRAWPSAGQHQWEEHHGPARAFISPGDSWDGAKGWGSRRKEGQGNLRRGLRHVQFMDLLWVFCTHDASPALRALHVL